MNIINYGYLEQSKLFFGDSTNNFKYIETPWWVTRNIANIIKPSFIKEENEYYLQTNQKVLVASGEQSFLYLMAKGMLPSGRYQTITPCFRNESHDYTHRKNFMKLELIIPYESSDAMLNMVIELAKLNFIKLSKKHVSDFSVKEVETEDDVTFINYDIEYRGTELGSYGIRRYKNLSWIYGTGLAEPRFSIVTGEGEYDV